MTLSERLEALWRLLQDPTGNTAALAAAIGITVLLVLVVVLVLLALALPEPSDDEIDEQTPEQAAAHTAGKRRIRLMWAGVLFIASLAATAAWYQSTSSVTYCTRVCHQMAKPSATWKRSAHAGVSCTRCHEGRPWTSILIGIPNRARSLYLYATGTEGGRGRVPAQVCLDCHTDLLERKITALNGETYRHREDYEAGRTCESCHAAQGHVPPTKR